jgi:hypothetical protein
VAGLLKGVPVVIGVSVFSVWSCAVFAALVVASFDWVASLIEVPLRPIAAAMVGWVLAFALLRGFLALPDLRDGLRPSACLARSRGLSVRG